MLVKTYPLTRKYTQLPIDYPTWQNVQQEMNGPEKTKIVVADELPLRGVLKCYCGKAVTGALPRGKMVNITIITGAANHVI